MRTDIFIHRDVRGSHVPVNQVLLSQLKGSLGKENFSGVLAQVKNLSREDIAALAEEFNGPIAPSASKTESLARIFSRHRKLSEFG